MSMRRGRKPNLLRLRQMQRLRAQGLTFAAIANELGVSRQAVHNALHRERAAPPLAACCRCHKIISMIVRVPSRSMLFCQPCLAAFPMLSFAHRLTSLRVMAGLTQAALAQATGVSQAIISRLEQGEHTPLPRTRHLLLECLEPALS